jgi:hypothetical protein
MGFLVHLLENRQKKTAYNVLKYLETLKELGKLNSMTMTEAVKISTLAFFKNKTETISILNQLRYKLTTTSNKSAKKLPPTDDAFGQHVLRY